MIKYLSKVLYVLTGSKKKLILIVLIFICTSLLEALGIGLIAPFLTIASNPESIHKFAILTWAYQLLNLQSANQFICILGLGIVMAFCLKSFFYLLAEFYVFKFSFRQKSLLRTKLLNAYLHIPYTFHLNVNTANIIKNSIIETNKFCRLTLLPLLQSTANIVLIFILLLLLARTDILLLVLTILVLTPVFLLFFKIRNNIAEWGKKTSLAEQEMIRVINHALGGIKETRIIGCESYFERQMEWQCKQYEESVVTFNLIQVSPRILIETTLIVFIIFFVLLSQIFLGKNIQEITSVIAVFSVAAMRLIPTMSNLIANMGKIQNSSYTLDVLCLDLKEVERQEHKKFIKGNSNTLIFANSRESKTMSFTSHLELRNLTYSYPGISKPAIKDISLNIKKGQSIAFIGKSGAGKTTLVDVILGLLKPQNGDILADNVSIYKNLRSWQDIIGYIPQSIFLTDNTIENNIAFGVPEHQIDKERLYSAIKAAQLEDLIKQLPKGIKTEVGERGVRLSGGQRQRIGIARCLYHEREILVLDEATSALDNETEKLVSEAISSLSGTKTLIMIAHRLSTVKQCDLIYVLEKGHLVNSGSYQEVVVEQLSSSS